MPKQIFQAANKRGDFVSLGHLQGKFSVVLSCQKSLYYAAGGTGSPPAGPGQSTSGGSGGEVPGRS